VHAQSRVSPPESRAPRGIVAALGLIAIAAVAAALWARWGYSLSVDEPFTALAVAQPISTLLETLRHDNTPVTYLALKLWTSLNFGLNFGLSSGVNSELALRSLIAIGYGMAVVATGLAGISLGGVRCGVLAALFVASSGSVGLLHAATIRPYALLCLFSALGAGALIASLRAQPPVGRRRWIALTMIHLLGLFTHPTYVFLALGSAAAVWMTRGSRGNRLATTGIVAVVIWLTTWGWMLYGTFSLPATAWLTTPHYADLWNAYLGIWGNRNGFVLVGVLLALLTAPGAARRVFADDTTRIVAIIATVALAGPFLVSYLKPVFHLTRTPTLALPFIALAAASVLATLGTRMLIVVISLLFVLGGAQYVAGSRRHGDPDPTRDSLAQVLSQARCGDVIVSAGLAYAPMTYYLRRLRAPQCIAHETFPADMTTHPGWIDNRVIARDRATYEAETTSAAERFARSGGRVFAFTKSQGTGADVGEMLGRALANRLRQQEKLRLRGGFFDEVTVYASQGEASRK
jgi:hypothetical protein